MASNNSSESLVLVNSYRFRQMDWEALSSASQTASKLESGELKSHIGPTPENIEDWNDDWPITYGRRLNQSAEVFVSAYVPLKCLLAIFPCLRSWAGSDVQPVPI